MSQVQIHTHSITSFVLLPDQLSPLHIPALTSGKKLLGSLVPGPNAENVICPDIEENE
jgi:hypothetical protein